jgi:hypothetical protein
MIYAGCVMFSPQPLSLREFRQWWTCANAEDCDIGTNRIPNLMVSTITPSSMPRSATRWPTQNGRQENADRSGMGV